MNQELTPLETARFAQCGQVLSLMAQGRSQKQACEEIGITVRQFRYWIQKQGGMDQLTDLVRDSTINALLTVMQSYQTAVDRLILIATDPKMLPKDQIAAIKELRVIINEVALPATRSQDGSLGDRPPNPAQWQPAFINAQITLKREDGNIIDVTPNPP